jgi:hypothetical protein
MKRISFLLILAPAFAAMAANCEGKRIDKDCIDRKKINPNTFCIEVYEPVCGCDGKTYPNTCYAERAGVTKWTPGVCPEREGP